MISPPSGFAAPVPLTERHEFANFNSGEPTLDDWLRKRALRNAELAATKTYVICPTGSHQVAGYYAVCMGQILNQDAVGSIRRNMPMHIPAVILARLAVDAARRGEGLGRFLLVDAARCTRPARSARLIVVHAISPAAERFYSRKRLYATAG